MDILKKKEDRRRAAITATEEEGEEEEKEGAHRGGQGETEEEEGGKMEERVNLRKTAVGKAREQQLEETQKRKEGQSTRHPVRLKLDEISDDYTYVSFGHMVPRYKHDAINRYFHFFIFLSPFYYYLFIFYWTHFISGWIRRLLRGR